MTEQELILGCVNHSAAHQRGLFDRYSRLLMTVCLRYAGNKPLAEDMLQESFVRIFSSIHQYRGEGSLEGWLRRVTVNTCLRKLPRQKMATVELSAAGEKEDGSWIDGLAQLSEKEILELIGRLPYGYRTVFNLYVLEGYSHGEIATMMGIEETTSRSQLIKARRLLQEQILSKQKFNRAI